MTFANFLSFFLHFSYAGAIFLCCYGDGEERTAYRWTDTWLRDGLITKVAHGHYHKVG